MSKSSQPPPPWGKCQACGETGPLSKEERCPRCRYPIAGITYDQALQEGKLRGLEADGYLPVTGWWRRRIQLFGYICPMRTREGWEIIKQEAEKLGVTNLILGTPREVLYGEE